MNREPYSKVGHLQLYKVKLVGGPAHGQFSLCSHNVVIAAGERYERGPDDLYYHVPKTPNPNIGKN